jgi:sugar phosphate isomerase/epimerase
MKLTVATCQFPIGSDIRKNLEYVSRQIRHAQDLGADVAHFPEACLSGYAGVDFMSYKGFDWDLLRECTQRVLDLARQFRLWVVLGSTHRLTGHHKPHNSLYIIDAHGEIVDRYDKMFCSGNRSEETEDLAHYSPGHHFSVFSIKGVRCGALICHDYWYPELYREYKRRGVQLVFHSYHAGNIAPSRLKAMRDVVGDGFSEIRYGVDYPRHHHARHDDRRSREQPCVDQLPQLLRPRKLLAELLRPSRRRRNGTFAAEHRRCPGVGGGH